MKPIASTFIAAWLCFTLSAAAETQPNILILFTDDQRADTIHAQGNPHIITPNLDRLSKRSRVFSNAYCFGAHTGAVCIASRNQFMTGNVWHRWAPKKHSPSDGPTLPKVLKASGYETFYREKSARANHPEILKQFDHFGDIHNVNALMSGRACKPFIDDALTFLKTERNTDKPFLMFLGLSGPHDPRYAEKRFRDQYTLADIPLPKNFKPLHHWDIGSMTIRDERLEKWPRDPQATRSHIFDYYALVTAMDHDIGRLLTYLEESGLDENTIIVFTSDHGLAIGSHGLFGKQNVYEAGMKVPFMIAGPGINTGTSDALVYLHDVFPTVADFGGSPLPADALDGKSLRPIVEGKQDSVRPHLSLAYQNSQRSIRDAEWKLMVFPLINKHQLFNLREDPDEMYDMSGKHPEQVTRLTKLMQSEQRRLGDSQPLRSDVPAKAEFTIPDAKPYPRAKAGGQAKRHTTD